MSLQVCYVGSSNVEHRDQRSSISTKGNAYWYCVTCIILSCICIVFREYMPIGATESWDIAVMGSIRRYHYYYMYRLKSIALCTSQNLQLAWLPIPYEKELYSLGEDESCGGKWRKLNPVLRIPQAWISLIHYSVLLDNKEHPWQASEAATTHPSTSESLLPLLLVPQR